MNTAKALIVAIGFVASLEVYLLMRNPHLRREAFRSGTRFSVPASLLGALAMLGAFALMAAMQ